MKAFLFTISSEEPKLIFNPGQQVVDMDPQEIKSRLRATAKTLNDEGVPMELVWKAMRQLSFDLQNESGASTKSKPD